MIGISWSMIGQDSHRIEACYSLIVVFSLMTTGSDKTDFYLETGKTCACCSRTLILIPSLISHWGIFGLNPPPLLPIPLGIPNTCFILDFLWEFWFSVSWPPPLKLPLTFNLVGFDIFWNLLTLKIIESSARQFSQLPCFSSCTNLCSKTGKLKVTHLSFLIFYDLQQSLRLMDLPILFMLSVSILHLSIFCTVS